jgi:Putative restriction endonuclease
MSTQQTIQVPTYYEFTEDDPDMADKGPQHSLAGDMEDLFKLLFPVEDYYIMGNMYIREKDRPNIAPDVFICKVKLSQAERDQMDSWDLSQPNRPAPAFVLEVASGETFPKDLGEKVERYRAMGVQEYFVYDPSQPRPVWKEKDVRLKGWKYVERVAQAPMSHPDATKKGWFWSEALQRWLAPAGVKLELYDAKGNRELTREERRQLALLGLASERERATEATSRALQLELEKQIREAQLAAERREKEEALRKAEQWELEEAARRAQLEVERQEKEAERQAKEAERQAKEAERQAKEAERQAKEVERQEKEAERARRQQLEAKLREMGVDVDNL